MFDGVVSPEGYMTSVVIYAGQWIDRNNSSNIEYSSYATVTDRIECVSFDYSNFLLKMWSSIDIQYGIYVFSDVVDWW